MKNFISDVKPFKGRLLRQLNPIRQNLDQCLFFCTEITCLAPEVGSQIRAVSSFEQGMSKVACG